MLRRAISAAAYLRSAYQLTRRRQAQVLEGRRTGAALRVLWVGNGPYREYLLPRLFPDGCVVAASHDVPRTAATDAAAPAARDCDLIAVERNRLLPPLPGFRRIPPGVRLSVAFGRREAPGWNTRHRWEQARKRVAAAGLQFRDFPVQDAPELLRRFYDELYAPHIIAQFGASHLEPFESLQMFYARGFLRLAFEGDVPVAGTVLLVEDRMLVGCKYGVRDPENKAHRAAASIYLLVDYAEAQGYEGYDAFHARPFFEDGGFNHKRSCGLGVRPEPWPVYPGWDEDLFLRVLRPAPGVLDFLRAEPHLRQRSDRSLAACLCPAEQADLVRAVVDEYERRRTAGISRYEFLVPRVPTTDEEDALREACGDVAASFRFTAFDQVGR